MVETPIWRYDITRSGPSCLVALGGEIDLEGAASVQDVLLAELDRPGTEAVAVDMSAVEFCDSSGLAALVVAYTAAQRRGRRFAVVDPSPGVRRVLDITGLLSLVDAA
jgi:anti-sigma B factor antagonist